MRGEFRGVSEDHFAVMGLPRAAWIDGEFLKERFHRLGAVHHPDVAGGSAAKFAELNSAWQALRDPSSRLRHFLGLTAPHLLLDQNTPPPELGDLFMEIATLKQSAQQFSAGREKAESPLLRAMLEPQRLQLARRHAGIAERLRGLIAEIEKEVREENATPDELAALLSRMTFLLNWERHLATLASQIA